MLRKSKAARLRQPAVPGLMPILALVLLLGSAVLHALWNLLLKQSDTKFITMGWQNIISGIISIFALFFIGLPPRSMWLLALLSGTLEAIYFGLLTFAYTDHDFSLVYPVARGAAPAMVVIWAALFLREIPSVGGFIGIALIVCGLVIIGATSLFQNGAAQAAIPRDCHRPVRGVHHLGLHIGRRLRGQAWPGSALRPELFRPDADSDHAADRSPLWLAAARRAGFRAQPARLILVGFLSVVAYLSALFAYSIAPVNYSEAIREVSVVMGAFAGWYFLGEQMGKVRILGAVAIFAGIVSIAVFG